MILKPNIIEAVNSLINAKQRSILALIGIVVGIGSVIAMVSVGAIVQQEALRQFMEMGTDMVTISESFAPMIQDQGNEFTPGPRASAKKLSLKTALGIPAACPGILQVAPYGSVYGTFKFQNTKKSVPALGVTPSFMDVNKIVIKEGRFIHGLDQNMSFCVVGEEVEQSLHAMGVRKLVGTRILFKEKDFTIIGVMDKISMGGMRPYELNQGILIPISMMFRLDKNVKISTVLARSGKNVGRAALESQVKDYLARQNSIQVDVRTAEELIEQMEKQMRLFTLLLGTIGSISLFVGGVGVMNVMLVSVSERTREIGIRRALGARQGDIMLQFLIESILLCVMGGIVGIAMGVGISWAISVYAKWHFSVSYGSIGLGVAVAAAVGVFFGLYPARQAALLNPILALRSE